MMNKQQDIFLKSLVETANSYVGHFKSDFTGNPRSQSEKADINKMFVSYLHVYSNLIYDGMLGNESIESAMMDVLEQFEIDIKTAVTNEDAENAAHYFVDNVNDYTKLLSKETK